MAEEEVVTVTPQAPIDHNHKRKLEDMVEPDAPAPDSTVELDGEIKEKDETENGDEDFVKRPRLDEQLDSLGFSLSSSLLVLIFLVFFVSC